MKIIACLNLKGGVGKTTCAVNIACALSEQRTVALVDADAQSSASEWLSADPPIQVVALPLEADSARDVSAWLARIQAIKADVLVLDLPPHLAAAAGAALGIADAVLVPCGPSMSDVRATQRTLDLIREARAERGRGRPACVIVPNRIDRRTGTGKGIGLAMAAFGEPVAPVLVTRQAHADAVASGEWIGQFAPSSPATDEIRALARFVERMLK